jgi:hypothetical protein
MPFEEIETVTKHNAPPTALVSYMRSKRGKNAREEKKPNLTITMPTTICGVGKAEKHVLLLGTGGDVGKLRIKGVAKNATKNGAVKPREFKSHFIWRFGYVPKLGEEIFDAERCDVRKIGDDEFEIDVNAEWFNAG